MEHKDSNGVIYLQTPEPLTPSKSENPLGYYEDYLMLMNFFSNSYHAYSGLAARKRQDGDEEAYKYYSGIADGIRHCVNNINDFKDKKFLDPHT